MASAQPGPHPDPPVAIVALTRQGVKLALRLQPQLAGSTCYVPLRHRFAIAMGAVGFERLADTMAECWTEYRALICIMAAGIVVRQVAPLLRHKTEDPAVVVMDEQGRYVISLLSGHLGGANRLAHRISRLMGGQAVITTASDVQGKPAIDLLARDAGLEVENPALLGRVARALVDEDPLWLHDPDGRLTEDLRGLATEIPAGEIVPDITSLKGAVGIWVSERVPPSDCTCLVLRPRNLVVGIGCNKGTASAEILNLLRSVFEAVGLSPLSIRNLTSIDLKAQEAGILETARVLDRPVTFFPAAELEGVVVPNPSGVVRAHIGVPSVCEATALLSAQSRNLVVVKQKTANATLAVARVDFPSSASDPAAAPT